MELKKRLPKHRHGSINKQPNIVRHNTRSITMSIASSAVLVELNISVWTAAKLDKNATKSVIADNNAGSQSGAFRKNLLAGTSLRKDISDYAAACRMTHNKMTLPWQDRGGRILPTSLFMDYKQRMNVNSAHFNSLVDRLCDNYDTLKQSAKSYMGALYDEEDYPSLDEVRSKFGFNLVFSPLAEAGDFRLDVPQQDLAEMRQQYEQDFNSRLADAMRKPWEDLHKMLLGMQEKLSSSSDDEKKRWHDTFVTNAQAMCGLLTNLNVTKDPKLEEARRDLELTMLGANIEVIKDSPVVRADMKAKIDTILGKFDW